MSSLPYLLVGFSLLGGANGCSRDASRHREISDGPDVQPATQASAARKGKRPAAPVSAPGPKNALRKPSAWRADADWSAKQRTQGAERRRLATVKRLFDDAGVSWPPRQVLLRGFKREAELEVWAAAATDQPLKLITRYGICEASGDLGPKRREGDEQVPEGFYRISYFNQKSRFHLSLRVNYPNASDQILSDKRHPGGDIMIHGNCVSIGCLAMSDERAEEIWVITHAAKRRVAVHLLPARDLAGLLADERHAEHHKLWRELQRGTALFEQSRRVPKVRVDSAGGYHFGD